MRRSFTLFSVGAHAIVMAAVLTSQLLADSSLPALHRPLLFDNVPFMPVEVQLVKPRVAPPATRGETVSVNAAPVIAPAGITPETERDLEPSPRSPGMIPGVETGPPSAIADGVGGTGVVAPPPPPVTAPVRLHSGMKAPVKTVHVAPVYPAIAQSARVQGVVILEAVLDATGRVESVRVLRSIPLLDQAAVDVVQQWRFTPALLNGQAVPVVMTVTVNFALQDR
jgi:TonB family protein